MARIKTVIPIVLISRRTRKCYLKHAFVSKDHIEYYYILTIVRATLCRFFNIKLIKFVIA